jgi:nitronate monooxygenase
MTAILSANEFAHHLDIRYPIIQAPMAGVSTPALAAAVSNAGGLGSLGIGASTTTQAHTMITQTQALTPHPFNVNVFCHAPAKRDAESESQWLAYLAPLFAAEGASPPSTLNEIYTSFLDDPQTQKMLLDTRPAVVSFHFGIPGHAYIAALKEKGIFTIATATSPTEAQQIANAGIDAIVAQGIEAGGHRGVFSPNATNTQDQGYSTMVLVQLLRQATPLPIIAAGGIMNGYGMRAALSLGAVAVQMGTAFVSCDESAANMAYRANLASASAYKTTMTRALSGRPARGLHNALITHGAARNAPAPAAYPVAYDAAKQLHAAAAKHDNHSYAAHWAGQGAPLVRPMPAGQLVEQIMAEYAQPYI